MNDEPTPGTPGTPDTPDTPGTPETPGQPPRQAPGSTPDQPPPDRPEAGGPGAGAPAAPGAPQPPAQPLTSEEMTMGMLCHLMALTGLIVPFGNIVGPLVMWLIKKDESAFVDDQGRESLNFEITVTIAEIICIPLVFICIGIPLLIVIGVAWLIFVIIASVRAASGQYHRYPMTFRFIK